MIGCLRGIVDALEEFTVNGLIATNNRPALEHCLTSLGVGYISTSFPDKDDARRHVPGLDVALPIAIEPPLRHPGKVYGRGAGSADARCVPHDCGQFF